MPSIKSDLRIRIECEGKSFSLNCVRLPDKHYLVKRGRSRSEKMPVATLTEIFETSRQWAVSNSKQ